MAPKRKGIKKVNDDWEAELGEIISSTAGFVEGSQAAETADNIEDDVGGVSEAGGLMAALKKNKSRKQKKGKGIDERFSDGEDPVVTNGIDGGESDNAPPIEVADKLSELATTDDTFGMAAMKDDCGKGNQAKAAENIKDAGDVSDEDRGTLKSKKEKEKERKEREKQRKKEQVWW